MNLFRANLRTRLTLLYASLLGVALLLYAGGVSALFLHNLRGQLDLSLDRDVETVEGSLSADANGWLHISSREGEAGDDDPDRGYFLEVWSTGGKLLYRTEQLNDESLGPVPVASAGLLHPPPQSVRLSSGMRLRSISRIHHLENAGQLLYGWPSARNLSGASFG
jgi:hypothetical protein